MAQAPGPKRRRLAATLSEQLDGDACREAISFLVHSPEEASVFQKIKMTLQHRQDLVHDPQRTTGVFKTFPHFFDVKGLVSCAFLLFKLQCFVWLDVSSEQYTDHWLDVFACMYDQQLNQDFLLLFGAETASKMLEKWDTAFRPKVIKEAKHLTQSTELCQLLKAAEKLTENDDTSKLHDMLGLYSK